MERVGFVMKLFPGNELEYQRRHEMLWPELQALLKVRGIREYSIFLHKDSGQLFAYLTIPNAAVLKELSSEPVMKKWWAYMKDIMESNPNGSPVSDSLQEMFYLP